MTDLLLTLTEKPDVEVMRMWKSFIFGQNYEAFYNAVYEPTLKG